MDLGFVQFNGLEIFYFACAVLGAFVLLIRMVMMMLGVHHDVDAGTGMDIGHHEIGDSDSTFRLISVHGLTGFFLVFGLTGLALLRQSHVTDFWSVAGAMLAGFITMVGVAGITSMMYGMQSSGTLDIRNAIGQEGTIYLSIPPEGTGKAQVNIQDRMRVCDAVSEDKTPLKTGERVRIVEVVRGNVLVVKKI